MRLFRRKEKRASIESPQVPISNANIMQFLGLDGWASASGVPVTIESALTVPAVWAAVNFIAGTLAGLPLHVYRKTDSGREKVSGGLASVLHDAPNDEMSSFAWRKYLFEQMLTGGRGLSFIERNAANRVINLWPLIPEQAAVKREEGRKFYEYRDGGRVLRYAASEIVDLPFMLHSDQLSHRSPLMTNKDVIGLAIAVTQYGSKFFQNGGVPPFAIEGPFQSPGAVQRASEDLMQAVRNAARENRLALSLPAGHSIKELGADPEKMQMVELQRFCVEQIARIYSLPPTFLQDLTHGTFSNTEQQDLHFVKHTLKRYVEHFEQELNLKLFGRQNNRQYVEMNVDGLLRGDFKTRMEGMAQAIQNGLLTPNEGRAMDNRPSMPNGDDLLIQGATVPLGSQPTNDLPAGGDEDGA